MLQPFSVQVSVQELLRESDGGEVLVLKELLVWLE